MPRTRKRNVTVEIEEPVTSADDEKIFDAEGNEEKPAPPSIVPDEEEPIKGEQETPAPAVGFSEASPEPEPEPRADRAEPPRRETRGRPKGGTNKKHKRRDDESEQYSPQNLTKLLLSLHQMAASLTEVPEILLTQEEAELLATNISEVEKLYSDAILSPEITAWSNLTISMFMVYYPRYRTIRKRMKAEETIEVTPISQAPPALRTAAAATH